MIELKFEKETATYFIRNGMFRTNCVCDRLTEQNLKTLHGKIGKILNIKDWKDEMEKDKQKFLGEKSLQKKHKGV